MLQGNEIIMALLGTGVLIFLWGNRPWVRRIPWHHLLAFGFYTLWTGWLFTLVEGFFLNSVFNFLEHLCYALSSLLLTAWCVKVLKAGRARK